MRRPLPTLVAGLALLAPAAAHAQTPASFVFQPGPSSAFGTSLKTDANGDAWLATYRSGVPGKVVISVRRADGTVRLVHTYTAPAGYSVLAPKITVRNGLATVAWSQYKGSSGIRAMAIRCKASGCGRAQEVGRGQRVKTEATPAVDQSGRSFVFWRGTSSKGPRLQWAVTTNGRFGKVHTLGQFGSGLAAIADPRGGELLAWTAPDGRVAVGRRSSGEVSTPQHLSSGPATDVQLVAAGPEVAAAWHDGRGDGEGQPGAGAVQAAIRGAGHYDFDPAQTVFAGNGRDIELAANASGRVAIAFADASANPDAVFLVTDYVSVRTGPGAAFGTPVRAGTGPLYTPPAVAVEPGGRVVAAWTQQADLQNQMHVDAAALRPQLDAFLPATDLGQGNAPLAASIAGGTVVAFSGPAAYQGALLSSAS